MTAPRWPLYFVLALMALPLGAQPSPSAPFHSIAEGTTFLVRLEDKLDASRARPGKRFKALLTEDLVGRNESRLFRNSRIKGHVSSVSNGLHPRLLLSFDEIESEHGWVPLIATITAIPGERGLGVSGEDGGIERQGSHERRDTSSSDEGSGRATLSAATGVVGALFSDRRLQLQKGTMMEIRLDRPLSIPAR